MERGIGDNSEAVAGDWVALARSTATHWLVGFGQPVKPADPKRGAFSRSEAWIDLIMLARWKPGQENNKGRKVDLDVGQLQGGYDFLADRWNWTVKQVRLFLSKLMGESMIAKEQPKISTPVNLSEKNKMQNPGTKKGKQSGNQIQVITLCNYRKYQVAQELMELEKGQAKRQARGKRGASEGQDLNKETKKQEERKKDNPPQKPTPDAARESGGGDMPGLNGSASMIVAKLAGWINPMMPDKRTAQGALDSMVRLYSATVVRDAFAELEAKMLHGDIIAKPIPYLSNACSRHAERRSSAKPKSFAETEAAARKAKIYRGVL